MAKTAVLFGGVGFIGSYLAIQLLQENIVEKIVLADIASEEKFWPEQLKKLRDAGKVSTVFTDVRQPIDGSRLPDQVELIVNLAAVHREPGHAEHEYYETNIPGAENVCAWAEQVGCKNIIFTSTIAVYGASAEQGRPKTEQTPTTPNTPYGISKLQAEEIHLRWQKQGQDRKLMIVRPGVIFGFGEKGNVTRMVKAILGGYFVFPGNKQTRKAGGYVKELCQAIVWVYQKMQAQRKDYVLFNFTMNPTPTAEEFSQAIKQASGKKHFTPSLPFGVVLASSHLISGAGKLIGKNLGINPARVHKMRRSNYIVSQELKNLGYQFQYSLQEAMADWKREQPQDWI